MRFRVVLLVSLLALAPVAGGGFAQVPEPEPQALAGSYRLGPRDLIAIQVFEVPELNVETRVSERGTVNLPLIGDVAADGLTAEEFEQRLEQLLESRYVNRASVSVIVREFRSRPIIVMGAVKSPGNLAFPGRWTLFEALAAAGGLGDNHGEYVYVLRRAANGLTDQVSVRVEDLMFKGDPRVNLPIYANDVINVPVPVEITIFCLGQVMSPGAQKFKSTDRVTVLTVVSRAGGLSLRASKKISVKKRRGDSLEQEVVVDYKKILDGKEPDIALEDGDVLVIKESFL